MVGLFCFDFGIVQLYQFEVWQIEYWFIVGIVGKEVLQIWVFGQKFVYEFFVDFIGVLVDCWVDYCVDMGCVQIVYCIYCRFDYV